MSLQKTIAMCIEFIIHTIEHSHLPSEYGLLPKTEKEMRSSDGPTGEPKERRGAGPWAVVLWQDDRHVLKELARQIRDGVGVKWEVAEQWVREAIAVVSTISVFVLFSSDYLVGSQNHTGFA